MSDIRLFLSTEEFDPVSAAIRWYTKCAWSHAGWIRKSDGWTFSAMLDGGVAWRPPNPKAKVLMLTADGLDATLARAESQTGDKYDWLDILGIAVGGNLQMPNRSICDKLVFWAYQDFGSPLVNHRFIPMEHLTPRDILLSPYVNEDTE